MPAFRQLLLSCALLTLCNASERLVEKEIHLLGRTAEDVMQELTNIPPKEFGQRVDHKHKNVPIVDPPTHIAGYFKLSGTGDSHMFYFFFKSRHNRGTSPLVLWTNGGPGCSSSVGVFFEQGPYKIEDDLTLSLRKHSWDISNNMIFVDQPIGTGFSYSSDGEDSRHISREGVAKDIVEFMHEFYAAHPDMAQRDFFVAGESYGGHYVPGIVHGILDANEAGNGRHIPLIGAAIGDGLTNPEVQFKYYSDYALENGLIGHQLYRKLQSDYTMCQAAIRKCYKISSMCAGAYAYCENSQMNPIINANKHLNCYDIRKPCVGELCYPQFDIMKKYLNLPSVQKELGVSTKWQECSSFVSSQMSNDILLNYEKDVAHALKRGVRIMIYVGDKDLICNWIGNRKWVDSLHWVGGSDWKEQTDFEWRVHGKAAGLVRETKALDLTFVKVYNAGHMVPMDQPANAFDMINRFIAHMTFRQNPSTDSWLHEVVRGTVEQ